MTAQLPEHGRPYPGHHPTYTDDVDVQPPVSVAGPHLLDGDLLSPADGDSKHLAECGWCQQRQQAAERHHDEFSDDDFLRAARQRAESGGAAALADVARLTPQLHTLVQEVSVREDVAVGQLWRLRWDDTTELAVVLDIDKWWVTIAPVSTELAAADEYCLLVPATASQLNTDLAICISLECVVPLFVFDRLITPASRPTLDQEQAKAQLPPPDTLRDDWRAWRRSSGVPAGLTYGVALDDGDFDRRDLRSVIATSFAALVGASSCIPGDPLGEIIPVAERITRTGLKLSELTATSGLEREVFLRIKQGGRVSLREAERLAGLLDTDVQSLLDGNPPLEDDLIVAVSRPRHRSALRRLAHDKIAAEGPTEDGQRWNMAAAVEPLAARSTAGHNATDARTHWDIKVDNYLQQRLSAIGVPRAEA